MHTCALTGERQYAKQPWCELRCHVSVALVERAADLHGGGDIAWA